MKNTTKFQFSILALVLLLTVSAFAVRLPTSNSDSGEWGTILNDFLKSAHNTDGSIKSNYITSSMILDATIAARDLASNSINTTHIVDGTIANADIASNAINGSQVAQTTGFNVSSLIVNLNNTGGRGDTAANISGIYINSTSFLSLAALSGGMCYLVQINMTGIPAGINCLPMVSENFITTGTTGNITFVGVNSTVGNCRIRVCNVAGSGSVTPGLITLTAMGIATGGV